MSDGIADHAFTSKRATFRPVTAPTMSEVSKCSPRRRWSLVPRYSLRTMLVVMTVACVVGGYWLNGAVRQARAVKRFKELAAHPSLENRGVVGVHYRGENFFKQVPTIPTWLYPLRELIGVEAFGEVIDVRLPNSPTTDNDLRYLADVPTVECLWLADTKVTEEGLPHLRACPTLRFLGLDGVPITDRGLIEISKFTELERLFLNRTKVTDKGLVHLKKLTKLKFLCLMGTAITDEGYRRLQDDLPKCTIEADLPACYDKYPRPNWEMAPEMTEIR